MQEIQGFITLIGSSSASPEELETAALAGEIIAIRNWGLISGGRGGVMAAAARSHNENGGLSIGILPGTDSADSNRYNSVVIPTGIGYARNLPNVLAGKGVVVVGGGAGTLSELGYSLQFQKPLLLMAFLKGVSSMKKEFLQSLSPGLNARFIADKTKLKPVLTEWLRDLE